MEEAKKDVFVEARSRGMSRRDAAEAAGIAGDGSSTDQLDSVQQELAAIREAMALNSGVTRDEIVAGFLDAAAMARTMSDPMGMIAAWRELGKLLGHYAPEVRKIEKKINKGDLLHAMDQLSDEELLRLAKGTVVEGKLLGKTVEKV